MNAAPTGRRRAGHNLPRLYTLPPAQLQQLCGWLAEGVTLATVRQRLKKQFKFSASLDAISRFAQEQVAAGTESPLPLLDVTLYFQGVPLRVRIDAPASALPGKERGQ